MLSPVLQDKLQVGIKMALGVAWLVIEESVHGNKPRLLSVLSPRKSNKDIAWYLEQSYVDRFASFEEAIVYKNDSKKSAFRIEKYEIGVTIVSCGHDPVYRAYRCHWLKKVENNLLFRYWACKQTSGQQTREEFAAIVELGGCQKNPTI